ncbi:MAG: right-handed parallel beta-helix repeat-containing protein [Ardenticatenales bacterium]|nr:right-handed parallel beta-helix repeat-containing protein [Ardenticatenales bacterium]
MHGITQAANPNFQQIQNIPTHRAWDWEAFTIGGDTYLAVANSSDDVSVNINSYIYRWNGSAFIETQAIPTNSAYDWEAFTIGGDTYLALANLHNGITYHIDSRIYRWNGSAFVEVQAIPTVGAFDWESFTIGSDTYLAVASHHNDSSYNADSYIYRWNGNAFVLVQTIPTNGATDWKAFTIGNDSYLALANYNNDSTVNVDSRIYRWNGSAFAEIQAIPTNGAFDWEAFTIGGDTYLAVANSSNGATHNINSYIYRWNGSAFVEVQAIPTNGAKDWEAFSMGTETYLAVANHYDGVTFNLDSRIYRWNGSSFVEIQAIPAHSAISWRAFTIGSYTYLAIANSYDGTTVNVDSVIYKAESESLQALVDAANPGETITLTPGTIYLGAIVNKPGLTIDLNGATLAPGSPALTITAADVTVDCAAGGVLDGDPGGAGGNSLFPAILVQSGGDNLIVDGCEIRHWEDGVQVAADVTSFKLVSGYLHDNTDAGLQIDSGVALGGVVTVRGNLFKANGGNGIQHDGASNLDAQYNSWGARAGAASGDGSGGTGPLDVTNPTFSELFFAPDPTDTALEQREVFNGETFITTVDVDAAGLYGVQFELTYDDTRLTLNSAAASTFAGGAGGCVLDTATSGVITGHCYRQEPDADAAGVDNQVITLDMTSIAAGTAIFDVATDPALLASAAQAGVKVYVNNGGFGAEEGSGLRLILDTNDGEIIVIDLRFTGFIDREGRPNDSGATIQVFDVANRATAVELGNGSSASSGAYTTTPLGAVLDEVVYLYSDAPLHLPTTADSATDYAHAFTASGPDANGLISPATVLLLGGDANDDNEITLADATCIGADFGTGNNTCADGGGGGQQNSDVNETGLVDLLDLVLMSGNYDGQSSPWTP